MLVTTFLLGLLYVVFTAVLIVLIKSAVLAILVAGGLLFAQYLFSDRSEYVPPQPPIDHRDCLSLTHGREGASAVVLHQRDVGPVRCAQQAPTSQPNHPAQLVIGPGEPVSKVLVALCRHGGESGDRDVHVYLPRS
jgi:hypothetical protein